MVISTEEITHRLTIELDDIAKAKGIVLGAGLGIFSLSETQLLEELETLYWKGYKACLDKLQIDFGNKNTLGITEGGREADDPPAELRNVVEQ